MSEVRRTIEVLPDAAAVARRGAEVVAAAASAALAEQGAFTFAVSGGRTPWAMVEALAGASIEWRRVGIWQVDERIAPDGDPDRNLTSLRPLLPRHVTLYPMPVTDADLDAAAERYAGALPPVFDLVHLGLGDDGHTASLVPGDPVLEVTDRDVALTGEYRGRRRMTLTYRAIARAGRVLWLVTGDDKASVLPLLLVGDPAIPAGRVGAAEQLVVADAAAAAELEPS